MKAKHIGIVAVSAEGAALCYRTICGEGAAILGAHAHPEISTHTYPLASYMRPIEAGRWDEASRRLLDSGRFEDRDRKYFEAVIAALAARGCDAVVLGSTEVPLWISQADSPLPVLDSTRILARAALREATKEMR